MPQIRRTSHDTDSEQGDVLEAEWKGTKGQDVEIARQTFERLMGEGYRPFRMTPGDDRSGEQILAFDPAPVGDILFTAPLAGG